MGPGWTEQCTAGRNGFWLVVNHESIGWDGKWYVSDEGELDDGEVGSHHGMVVLLLLRRAGLGVAFLLFSANLCYLCFGYVCDAFSSSLTFGRSSLYEWMDGWMELETLMSFC